MMDVAPLLSYMPEAKQKAEDRISAEYTQYVAEERHQDACVEVETWCSWDEAIGWPGIEMLRLIP